MEIPPVPPIPSPSPISPTAVSGTAKIMVLLCHLSAFISLPFILPLIVYLVKRGDGDGVSAHAREVLNFHISMFLYAICCVPLCFILIGIPLELAIVGLTVVCAIIGAIQASEGRLFHYPLTIRLMP